MQEALVVRRETHIPAPPAAVFALLTEASIGQLFIASVGPAVLIVLLYLMTVTLIVHLSPGSAPEGRRREAGELRTALLGSGAILGLFLVVMGGLYLGVFTATESAAVGAVGAFVAPGQEARPHCFVRMEFR